MGTSDAFGGSNTQNWNTAKDSFISNGLAGGAANSPQMHKLVQAIGAALQRGNGSGPGFPLADLLGNSRADAGTSAGGHGRSRRGGASASRQAARGGAAIAGFDAWRRGDAAAAQECGLNLLTLDGLDDRSLCVQLVDAILGPPAHPEDVALRKAIIGMLRKAMREDPPPTVTELVDRFVESLAWEMSIVQIATDLRAKKISESKAKLIEKKARRYIANSVRQWKQKLKDHTPQFIANYASKLAARACKNLGNQT